MGGMLNHQFHGWFIIIAIPTRNIGWLCWLDQQPPLASTITSVVSDRSCPGHLLSHEAVSRARALIVLPRDGGMADKGNFAGVASGKRLHNYGKSPCSLGKLTNFLWLCSILVGGFNSSEKKMSIGMIIPNIWKNKSHVPNHQPDFDITKG